MKAIRTTRSNFTYLGPTDEISDLPVERNGRGVVYGVFELTDAERTWIANGAQVKIGIWQEPMPPVSISVVKEEASSGGESERDYRCANCDALYVETRAVKIGYRCGHCSGELLLP